MSPSCAMVRSGKYSTNASGRFGIVPKRSFLVASLNTATPLLRFWSNQLNVPVASSAVNGNTLSPFTAKNPHPHTSTSSLILLNASLTLYFSNSSFRPSVSFSNLSNFVLLALISTALRPHPTCWIGNLFAIFPFEKSGYS